MVRIAQPTKIGETVSDLSKLANGATGPVAFIEQTSAWESGCNQLTGTPFFAFSCEGRDTTNLHETCLLGSKVCGSKSVVPTLRRKREGWSTRNLVAGLNLDKSETVQSCPYQRRAYALIVQPEHSIRCSALSFASSETRRRAAALWSPDWSST
jgi:hypothetical protein